MAAFSKTAEAVIKVKADTKQANAGLGKTIKVMAGLTAGVFAAKKAFDVLSNAADEYSKRQQLMAAAGSASFKELQSSARGLITEHKALEVSAALMNGAFKVSQEEMNTAAKAMVALRNQGNDFNLVIDNVTRALVEGNGRALRQFGVNVEGGTGKVETFNNVMRALNDLADSQHAKMDIAGDSMLRAGNKYKDAVQQFTDALGRLAIALTPVVERLASMTETIVDFLSPDRVIGQRAKNLEFEVKRMQTQRFLEERRFEKEFNERIDAMLLQSQLDRATDGRFGAALEAGVGFVGGRIRGLVPESFRRGPGRQRERAPGGGGPGFTISGTVQQGEFGGTTRGIQFGDVPSAIPGGGLSPMAEIAGFAAEGRMLDAGMISQLGAETPSNLTKIREAMASIEPVASTFAAAGASAFNAWIQGSASTGEAIKKFIGGALTSIATQMAGEAIKHGAMAIGSLAFGDGKGAALHGKAAAMHAAGALSIGAMAKAMGGGGSAGRARGGLPGAAAGAFGGAGGGGSSTTIVVAPNPFDHNPRESIRRTRRAISTANGRNPGTGTVTV